MPNFVRTMLLCLPCMVSRGQSLGNYGTVKGLVVDPSSGSIASARITLRNALTDIQRTTASDSGGVFRLTGIPFGAYQLVTSAQGFRESTRNVSIESPVPVEVNISLTLAGSPPTSEG